MCAVKPGYSSRVAKDSKKRIKTLFLFVFSSKIPLFGHCSAQKEVVAEADEYFHWRAHQPQIPQEKNNQPKPVWPRGLEHSLQQAHPLHQAKYYGILRIKVLIHSIFASFFYYAENVNTFPLVGNPLTLSLGHYSRHICVYLVTFDVFIPCV